LAIESDKPVAQTAREIGVNENTLHTWISKYGRPVDNIKAVRTDKQPKSLTELAELSGRKVPNLSRTLKTMADYSLVSLQRNIRDIQPTALATELLVVLDDGYRHEESQLMCQERQLLNRKSPHFFCACFVLMPNQTN